MHLHVVEGLIVRHADWLGRASDFLPYGVRADGSGRTTRSRTHPSQQVLEHCTGCFCYRCERQTGYDPVQLITAFHGIRVEDVPRTAEFDVAAHGSATAERS